MTLELFIVRLYYLLCECYCIAKVFALVFALCSVYQVVSLGPINNSAICRVES